MTSAPRELLVVADASPLILLAKLRRLSLLTALTEQVWVPAAVWNEIVAHGEGRPEVAEIVTLFASAIRDADPDLQAAFALQVDAGEAAALALAAKNRHALLLIDDRRGRRLAAASGLRHLGTLGLLLRAKRHGLIVAIAPELAALRQHGLFVDEHLVREVLKAANE